MPTPDERIDKLEAALGSEKRFLQLETKVETLEKTGANQLVILGETLRMPLNRWVALILVILFTGLFALLWLTLVKAAPGRVSEILFVVLQIKNGQAVQDKSPSISAIYTLTTPHEKTLEDLDAKSVPLSPEQREYYKLNDGALEAFGKQIKKEGAQGYTRREVWGEGTMPLKRGWEWTITWRSDHAITVERLAEIFAEHFRRTKDIYIEERRVGKTLFDRKMARE